MLIRNRRAQDYWQCITGYPYSLSIPSHPPSLYFSRSIVARSSARLWKLITHQCALLIRLRAVIIGSWISYYGTKRQQNSPPHKIGHPYCPSLIRLLVISKAFIRCYVTERGELSVSLSSARVSVKAEWRKPMTSELESLLPIVIRNNISSLRCKIDVWWILELVWFRDFKWKWCI